MYTECLDTLNECISVFIYIDFITQTVKLSILPIMNSKFNNLLIKFWKLTTLQTHPTINGEKVKKLYMLEDLIFNPKISFKCQSTFTRYFNPQLNQIFEN